MTTRRSFLREIAAGAALMQVALDSESLAQASAAGEEYWQLLRAQFSFTESKVPMNAANLCPSPRAVENRVTELTADLNRDVSFQNRNKFTALREGSRDKVARQMGVSPDEIALVRNTSEANNTINAGLALSAGDEVLLWDQNHPTNNVAWDVRAARYGSVIKRVSTPTDPASAQELIDAFASEFTARTKVLAITHISNVSGIKLPVRDLVDAAHSRGIYVHVDGAQSWGALDINLREMGCDSYSASTHKWFMGPKEAGLLYVKADNVSRIWPSGVAPGWGDDVEPDPEGARKFESLGQRDDACLAAIGTAADFHSSIGPARIEARTMELTSALKTGITEAGLKLVTPFEPELSGGVCIVVVDGDSSARSVMSRLYEEHGIAAAPTGGLRLSPHIYNTMEHIERAIEGVKTLLT